MDCLTWRKTSPCHLSFEKKIGCFSALYFLALSIIFFIPSLAPCLSRYHITIGSIFLGTSGLLLLIFYRHKKKDFAEKALVKIDFSNIKKQQFFQTSAIVNHIFSFLTVDEGIGVCNTCREGAFFLRVNVVVHRTIFQPILVRNPSNETLVLINKIRHEGVVLSMNANFKLRIEEMNALQGRVDQLESNTTKIRQDITDVQGAFAEIRNSSNDLKSDLENLKRRIEALLRKQRGGK